MMPLPTIRLLGFLLLSGAMASPAANAKPAANQLESVWRLGSQGLFAEAAQALPETASSEEAVFTRAVLLLNRQPRTETDMKNAIRILRDLGQSSSTAELRARSLFIAAQAESLQTREQSADPTSYQNLWHDYPQQPYGQRALVHLMLMAFDTEETRESILARCAELERQADALTDQMARSHFHQVAARGYLYLGGQEVKALKHLLRVNELGVARRETLGDLHVSIGQLASEQGRPELARTHYFEFLRLFPNDPRVYTINANLGALPIK